MMKMQPKAAVRVVVSLTAIALIFSFSPAATASTIIKLSLGGDPTPDVEFTGGGVFSTIDDGIAATTGEQNTAVDFLDFLSGNPDVGTATASYSLDGVLAVGAPVTLFGTIVVQNFFGGTFSLYSPAPANTLMLSGSLTSSVLSGPLGPPATGALFTTTFGAVTGGTLAPLLVPGTLTLSISMSDVNGGVGLGLLGGVALAPFTADVTESIAAEQAVPESSCMLLAAVAGILFSAYSWRRK